MLHARDIIVAPGSARITGFGIADALSNVGAKLPTRALNAAPDIDALRAIVAGIAGATGAVGASGATGAQPAPIAPVAPIAPLAPIAPITVDDFDLRIEPRVDLMVDADDHFADRFVVDAPPVPPVAAPSWSAPARALQATGVEEEPSRRWPIVAMSLLFAIVAALSVGFFLRSPRPVPVPDKPVGVDETIVDLPASAPAPNASASAPTSPNATADRPNAPVAPNAPSPSPSRSASGAIRPAQTGSVLIRSTPADADVIVNGKPRGKTPLALRELALGSYTIRVAHDGYAPEERTLQLTSRRPATSTTIALRSLAQKTNADAAEGVGRLNVQSRPAGARVFVNNRLAGATPIAIPGLPAGPATVRIEMDGYRVWTTKVQVKAGEQTRVAASLERP